MIKTGVGGIIVANTTINIAVVTITNTVWYRCNTVGFSKILINDTEYGVHAVLHCGCKVLSMFDFIPFQYIMYYQVMLVTVHRYTRKLVPAEDLAPNGDTSSADTMMTPTWLPLCLTHNNATLSGNQYWVQSLTYFITNFFWLCVE